MEQADRMATIVRQVIGAVLMLVGILLLFNVLNSNVPQYWLAALITLIGVFVVSSVPMVGASMMGIGIFMLLRDFGVIDTPWLGYAFSLFLVVVGLYGIFGGMWHKKMDEKSETTKTE